MIQQFSIAEAIELICDRLSERTATLFLGAGINASIENKAGEKFPIGKGVANWLAKDILGEPDLDMPLTDVAEMARYKVGEEAVNEYLYRRFREFRPGTAQLALMQLPWDVIYTTNYDLLIEDAATFPSIRAAGKLKPVFSIDGIQSDLTSFSEEDIPYYKLHGSIDFANSEQGRLILTKDDFRHYELHRKPLFKRLARDLMRRTFVFVGYSLTDDNFRAILDDCRAELGIRDFPLSFAITRHVLPVQETFWREKYNIQLVSSDGTDFLESLKGTWQEQDRGVTTFEERRAKIYLQVDKTTTFPKVAESFYQVRPSETNGQSQAKLFFRGAEASWADIRDKVAPKRDAYWSVLEAIFPELAEPAEAEASIYLITGAAGTGKTTLVRTIAYDLAKDFQLPVLVHIPGTPLESRFLGALVEQSNPQRIIVIVRHAAEYIRDLERFVEDIKRRGLPVTILLEERKNQWNMAVSSLRSRLAPVEFELGVLSEQEIELILHALGEHNALEKLAGTTWDYQLSHFNRLADKELLVALRELTSQGSFDDYVRDEYDKIPSQMAKRAYVYVAAVGQLSLALRYEVLIRLLHLTYDQLGSEVFRPAEGVLISTEEMGSSRHNAGFRLTTRHPVIASIIFDTAAPDDDTKLEIINTLLTQLDPGFREDYWLLREITRGHDLINTIASPAKRRAVYEHLMNMMPEDAFVLRHRSILERNLNDPEKAIQFARQAVRLDRSNAASQNTLGLALELGARATEDPLRRQAMETEAAKLFNDGVRNDPTDAFGYLGKAYLLRNAIRAEKDLIRKAVLQADVLSLLEEAYEATNESDVIALQLAQQRQQIGETEEVAAILRTALERSPANARIRDLWIRLEIEEGNTKSALELALEGAKIDPTAWKIQRHIARLLRQSDGPVETVKGHYEAAIRHHKDIALLVELGAYVFQCRLYQEARNTFFQARDLPAPAYVKRESRERWRDDTGKERVFKGRVNTVRGALGYLTAVPENFEAAFWRTDANLELRVQDEVQFTVGFNAFGATAVIRH